MFEQLMSTDLPNQMYAELVQVREQQRLARRIARQRKAGRDVARRPARRNPRPQPGLTTVPAPDCG